MKRFGFNLFLTGLMAWFAVQSAARAETNDLPHFQEVLRLLRANLPNVSEEDLNQAAVRGLIDHFQPRVLLVTNEAATGAAEAPLLSKTAVYDKFYGYLRVARIAPGLADQIKQANENLNTTNKLKGLILDLRFAGGQDYPAAASAADRFLSTEQPLLNWEEGSARSTAKPDPINLPVSVLINHQTAGAAEALAAVLREADAAVLVGARTAGQAQVFKEFKLSNGQRLRIATGQVQIGNSTALPAGGVVPDVEVSVSSDDEKAYFADAFKVMTRASAQLRSTNTLAQAGSTNRAANRYPRSEAELVRMQREGLNPNDDDPALPESSPAEESSAPVVRDPVLARGLDLLKGIAIVERSMRR